MPRRDHQNPHTRKAYNSTYVRPIWAGWVDCHRLSLKLIVDYNTDMSVGPNVAVNFETDRYNIYVNFTDLTTQELDAVQGFLGNALNLARTVTRLRDMVADEQAKLGNDFDNRVYRRAPEVVTRPWAEQLNPASILIRPKNASAGNGSNEYFVPGSARRSGKVVKYISEYQGVQDYPEED
jgi:hypothetical protein